MSEERPTNKAHLRHAKRRELILNGPLARTLVTLALPVSLGMLPMSINLLIDFYWVGKIGIAAQSAVITIGLLFMTVLAISRIIGAGSMAYISQFVGAGENKRARHAAIQTLYLSLTGGIILIVVITILKRQICLLLGITDDPALTPVDNPFDNALMYLTWIGPAFALVICSMGITTIYQATGNTTIPMWIGAIGASINILLDPFFAFHEFTIAGIVFHGIGMGVGGTALATSIAVTIECIIGFLLLFTDATPLTLAGYRWKKPDLSLMRQIVKVGGPVGIRFLLIQCSVFFLNRAYWDAQGQELVTAIGAGLRYGEFAFIFIIGLSIASTTIIGQNLGAGNVRRTTQVSYIGILLGLIAITPLFLAFWFFGEQLAGLMINDPAVIPFAQEFFRFNAVYLVLFLLANLFSSAFQGSGHTLPILITTTIRLIVLIIAYFVLKPIILTYHCIYYATLISYITGAGIIYCWFLSGKWKKPRIHAHIS